MPRVARERKEGRKNLILSSQQSPAELAAWHPFQPRPGETSRQAPGPPAPSGLL